MIFFPIDAKLCSKKSLKLYVHLQINQLELQVQKKEEEEEQQQQLKKFLQDFKLSRIGQESERSVRIL